MEKTYWLGRKRASLKLAQNASCPEARLVHYDLAGRYSLKAMSAKSPEAELADVSPLPIVADCASGSRKVSWTSIGPSVAPEVVA